MLAFITGLAFLVARPSREQAAATPYVGERGASRATASGLGVAFTRAGQTKPLAPGTPLAAGDRLRFTVRAERSRHLLVRLRDGAGAATTIFPTDDAGASAPVQPGETLPATPIVGAGAGKVVVTAIFADHPFALDGDHADTEEVDLVMEKE
ncbi:MAG TPA: hypothetical protein VHJ20_01910 [Polyangia bacterium]|nr:hypothetical protein [Polyangia bacterium]